MRCTLKAAGILLLCLKGSSAPEKGGLTVIYSFSTTGYLLELEK